MENHFYTNASSPSFLERIKDALAGCRSFAFSVSFIKAAGLVLLKNDLEKALKRGATGRIITSGYKNFTDVSSLQTFLSFQKHYPDRFACHFDLDSFTSGGFHVKGYLFDYGNKNELIVGSSNLTRYALLCNQEWDLGFQGESFESYAKAQAEFDALWEKTSPLNEDVIERYKKRIEYAIERWDMDADFESGASTVRPNLMQQNALKEIRRYRDMGENKALVVASMGTGKTYLSAFDAFSFGAERLLYVVHREEILEKAMETFEAVFGKSKTMGLFTGHSQDPSADFIFATNGELSRHLHEFSPTEFDYIILDECHHAVASSYQKIVNYFHPTFLLGLTATPNRMDNQDVLGIFGNNVPYSLTLAEALENGLVVGFHYFGIKDDLVDYSLDKKDLRRMIGQLTSEGNVDLVESKIREHLPENGKLKAIGFCRNVDQAMRMAEEMNARGYPSTHLTGHDDSAARNAAFQALSDESNPLQIIFTVDILNEGVDIPAINMVMFLRPTDSPVVFLQQLGRGLRKYPGKPYLTVLDFIGNSYQRYVQVVRALNGLNAVTLDKPSLLKRVREGVVSMGSVELHFDEKAIQEILDSIERTSFNQLDFLKADYAQFKRYLGTTSYPSHVDYLDRSVAPDLLRFINSSIKNKKNGSYYAFLEKIGETSLPSFSEAEQQSLVTLSSLLPLGRPDDYAILLALLDGDKTEEELKAFDASYGLFKENQFTCALRYLTGFYGPLSFSVSKTAGGRYHFDASKDGKAYLDHLRDLLTYGLERFKRECGDFEGTFKPYMTYNKAIIMMLLGRKPAPYMKGTLIEPGKRHGYLFVGLKKDKSVEERLNYQDKFLSPSLFQWESENDHTFSNNKGKAVLAMKRVSLFVRKIENEDGIQQPFLYIGEGEMTNARIGPNAAKTLLFDVKLDQPVPKEHREDLMVPDKEHEA